MNIYIYKYLLLKMKFIIFMIFLYKYIRYCSAFELYKKRILHLIIMIIKKTKILQK